MCASQLSYHQSDGLNLSVWPKPRSIATPRWHPSISEHHACRKVTRQRSSIQVHSLLPRDAAAESVASTPAVDRDLAGGVRPGPAGRPGGHR
jgi:hypothetical protein